jgi:hypothetical protein
MCAYVPRTLPCTGKRSQAPLQHALFSWLAKLAAKRRVSLALACAVVIADRTTRWHVMPFLPQALQMMKGQGLRRLGVEGESGLARAAR